MPRREQAIWRIPQAIQERIPKRNPRGFGLFLETTELSCLCFVKSSLTYFRLMGFCFTSRERTRIRSSPDRCVPLEGRRMACKDREGTGSSTSRWVPSPVEGTNAGGSGCLRLEGFSRGVPVKKKGDPQKQTHPDA